MAGAVKKTGFFHVEKTVGLCMYMEGGFVMKMFGRSFMTLVLVVVMAVSVFAGNVGVWAETVPLTLVAIGNFHSPGDTTWESNRTGARWTLDANGVVTVEGGTATSLMRPFGDWENHWMPNPDQRATVR